MPKRCALGCPPLGVPTHVFPKPDKFPDVFKAWVKIVGGRLDSPENYEFYRKQIICDIHFTDSDRNRNKRLNALAVPSLFLPGKPAEVAPTISSTKPESTSVRAEASADINLPSTSACDLPSQSVLEVCTSCEPLNVDHSSTTVQYLPGKPAQEMRVVASGSAKTIADSNESLSASSAFYLPNKNIQEVSASSEPMDVDYSSTTALKQKPGEAILSEHNYIKRQLKNDTIRRNLVGTSKPVTLNIKQNKEGQQIKNLKSQIKRLQKRGQTLKQRLINAEKISDDIAFKRVTRNMSLSAKIFTRMQMTQSRKKPSGRRFSLEEKILSLSFFKRSPKCYALLANCFTLPSTKTLKSLLAQIKLGSGLIDVVFDNLKETIEKMNSNEKLYSLIFDEMALSPQIQYNSSKDKLYGFSDFGENELADHVLVFMIKGIKANFKQPVAYYFTNTVNKIDLKLAIIKVIQKLQGTGLNVMCTVCDQGSANVAAIKDLVQESKNVYLSQGKAWRHDFFEVNNRRIIPLYDVPHLIKGLRNNLLTKDLKYVDEEGRNQTIRWEYFRQVCTADKNQGELSLLHKITEEHLDPNKFNKMRVKPAAQIFSHSVAVVTEHLTARGLIDGECRQIIPFVLLIDKLFDSLNASTLHIPNGKFFKQCVKKNSPHHTLWEKAIKMLKNMKFIQKKKRICRRTRRIEIHLVESVTPTIKNLITTIEGIQVLWNVLSQEYSFDCLMTRHLNQDPLENFFGNIRSYGVRNIAPNCLSFEGAYKALLLNNFNSPHSIRANCEKDRNVCLQNFSFFFKQKKEKAALDVPEEEERLNVTEDMLFPEEEIDTGVRNYVSGWILKKCLTNVIRGCSDCKTKLVCQEANEKNQFIKLKEYNKKKKWLVYPSEDCEKTFREIQDITVSILKKDVPKLNLKQKIITVVNTIVYFPCTCEIHYNSLRNYFQNIAINVLIYSWCRTINRILAGKTYYSGDDITKTIAQQYFNKKRHYKTKI